MTFTRRQTLAGAAAIAAVAAVVGFGLASIGPPGAARARRLDAHRIDDLRHVARVIDVHWTRDGDLPASLVELPELDAAEIEDPVSGRPYYYRVVTGSTFELCATFDTEATRLRHDHLWRHPSGRHCFRLEVEEARRHFPQEVEGDRHHRRTPARAPGQWPEPPAPARERGRH